jgi:hypothetical protein
MKLVCFQQVQSILEEDERKGAKQGYQEAALEGEPGGGGAVVERRRPHPHNVLARRPGGCIDYIVYVNTIYSRCR